MACYNLQERQHDERHKWTYAWRLARFVAVCGIDLVRRHRKVRYDVIHVHNMPDFLVFAALYPKLTGAKVILDVHDIVPEMFANKFHAKADGLYVSALKGIEKASAAFADHVIVANHIWYERLLSRSVPRNKCSVILNHVDESIFYRRERSRNDDKVIVLFPGSFSDHQGLDVAIRALGRLRVWVPNAELHLCGGGGGGGAADRLKNLAQEIGVEESVKFRGLIPLEEVPEVIANADLGVVPKRADSFGNEAYSTKIMEFMSQGVPAVVSRTKIDTLYFDEGTVCFFPSGNDEALAEVMRDLIGNAAKRDSVVAKGYEYVAKNGWSRKKGEYLSLVDTLIAGGSVL